MNKERKKYQPSTSDEGAAFMSNFCDQCKKNIYDREGEKEGEEAEFCDILIDTMVLSIDDANHPSEWQYGEDGRPECTAFIHKDTPDPFLECEGQRKLF